MLGNPALPGWHWRRGNPRSGAFTRASPSSCAFTRASPLQLRFYIRLRPSTSVRTAPSMLGNPALPGWHWRRGNPRSGAFTRAPPSYRTSLLGLRPREACNSETVQILPHLASSMTMPHKSQVKNVVIFLFLPLFLFSWKIRRRIRNNKHHRSVTYLQDRRVLNPGSRSARCIAENLTCLGNIIG